MLKVKKGAKQYFERLLFPWKPWIKDSGSNLTIYTELCRSTEFGAYY